MTRNLEFEQYLADAEREADESKDSSTVLRHLSRLYESMTPAEKNEANETIGDWLLDEDEHKWHTGILLARELQIRGLLPRLRALEHRFRLSHKPGAPMWADVVARIVRELS